MKKKVVCWECGQFGHVKKNCPKAGAGSASSSKSTCPLPSATWATNFRSIVLAATVCIQGAKLLTVDGKGPEFPAEAEVKMPFLITWKDPIAIGSSKYCLGKSEPRDTKITSTPFAIASSKPARISADEHPNDQQTLYMAILAPRTPPVAVPSASPK
ncbi:hypothetical protein I3760_11G123000 [Carya illinoinensis]|nr:hypothetical protein I3760_11G123000 [Carya illinoinensis]